MIVPFWSAGFIFYDTKVTVMNRVLNATVQRTADHAAPEITLDPLEIVGGMPFFRGVLLGGSHPSPLPPVEVTTLHVSATFDLFSPFPR